MAKIVFAWELGGEFGHISRLLTFAEAFRARGHEVCYILKDLSRAQAMLGASDANWYQAPHWIPTITGLPDAVNCAETLIRFGYLEPEALTGICRAWRNLYALIKPDLLFCDFAPTALLAARGLSFPTAVSDTGYGIPPASSPLPPYCWWLDNGAQALPGAEEQVLASINQVAANLGADPLSYVHEVFRGDTTFLCTYPELDHYPQREATEYFGAIANQTVGDSPKWPSGKGPRVFMYLKPNYPGLTALCRALSKTKARIVAFVPGIDAETRQQLKSSKLTFAERPLRMTAVRAQCDAAISHAGIGTVATLLTAGKPMLVLPSQSEQGMIAMRVRDLGAGIVSDERGTINHAPALVKQLLEDPGLRESAKGFAKRYRGETHEEAVQKIVTICEAKLG